jgi:hypothetical protein
MPLSKEQTNIVSQVLIECQKRSSSSDSATSLAYRMAAAPLATDLLANVASTFAANAINTIVDVATSFAFPGISLEPFIKAVGAKVGVKVVVEVIRFKNWKDFSENLGYIMIGDVAGGFLPEGLGIGPLSAFLDPPSMATNFAKNAVNAAKGRRLIMYSTLEGKRLDKSYWSPDCCTGTSLWTIVYSPDTHLVSGICFGRIPCYIGRPIYKDHWYDVRLRDYIIYINGTIKKGQERTGGLQNATASLVPLSHYRYQLWERNSKRPKPTR